ncbi:MAG: DUF4823 domain-containing protein [Haliea sp.]
MKKLLVIALIFLITGCTSKYRIDAAETPLALVSSGKSFHVILPADGHYGRIKYSQSGMMLASEVRAALSIHASKVLISANNDDIDKALIQARNKNFDYVIEPMILHWEDRATEWSGRPDRITIRFVAFDVKTGKKIASTVRSASSKWFTFGGDHPQDLLPELTRQFAAMLFGNLTTR